MSKQAFTEHPEFMKAGQAANQGIHQAIISMGLDERDLFPFDVTANRLADDLTKLLLRAQDAKQKSAA